MTTAMAMEGSDVGEDSNSMNIDVGDNSRDYDSGKSNDNDNDDRNRTDCDVEVSDDTQDCERLNPADLNSDRTPSPHRRSPVDNPNGLDIRSDTSPGHQASPLNHVNGSPRNHSDAESPANHNGTKSPHLSSHESPKSQNGPRSPRDFVDSSSPGRHHSKSPSLNGNHGTPDHHGSAGIPNHHGNVGSPGHHSNAGTPNHHKGSLEPNCNTKSPDHHGNARSPNHRTGSLERDGNTGGPDAGSPRRHANHGSPRHDGTTSSSGRKRHNSDIPQQDDDPACPELNSAKRSLEFHEKERRSDYFFASMGSPRRHTSMANQDLNDRRATSQEFRIIKSPGHDRNTRSPDHNAPAERLLYHPYFDRKYNNGKIGSPGNRERAVSPGQRNHTDSPVIPKTGSPGFHGNTDQHSEDSTSCSPCEERSGNTSPQLPAVLPPVKVTNFSITEILKPSFGPRRCSNVRACPPVLPESPTASAQRNYSLDLRDRQRFSLPRETRPDYGARGVKQLPNYGLLHPYFSRQSEARDPQSFSRELSRGPLDMTRHGQEALERNRKSQAESRVVPPGTPRPEGDPRPQSSSSSLSSPEPGAQPPQSPREGTSGQPLLWPAWVYCTRYSDRPSAGPRTRKRPKRRERPEEEEKRPRTAFSSQQLQRLRQEFETCRYLTEQRRQDLARELQLTESQIKIWFQNKRAKIKKASGAKNPLALSLMAQGLYNHATVPREPGDPSSTAITPTVNLNIDT